MEANRTQEIQTESEVAEQLRVSEATLRRWRTEKFGPRYFKVGVLVRYRAGDVFAFLDKCPSFAGDLPKGAQCR
jgi:nitrite reductase/ring-hydroxylating ferredoxin subunit